MPKRPDVTIKLMLRVDDHIFMLRHRTNGAYDFPGGRMEWGESPEEALARELREELAYTLSAKPVFFGIWNDVASDKSRHSLQLHYLLSLPERPMFAITENAEGLWLDKTFYQTMMQDTHRVERMFA